MRRKVEEGITLRDSPCRDLCERRRRGVSAELTSSTSNERTSSLSKNLRSRVVQNAADDLPPDGLRSLQRESDSTKLRRDGAGESAGDRRDKSAVTYRSSVRPQLERRLANLLAYHEVTRNDLSPWRKPEGAEVSQAEHRLIRSARLTELDMLVRLFECVLTHLTEARLLE